MKIIFGLSLILLLFSSCSKEKKQNKLITGHVWKIESLISGGVDITSSCNNDDRWIFSDSGTFEWDAGSVLCSASSASSVYGTWDILKDDEITIQINGSSEQTGTLSLTEDAMIWTFPDGVKFVFLK